MARTADEPGHDLVAAANRDRELAKGPFARIALFFRQVINELKKVVTPTRKELLTYTGVVLVFVVIMMTIVYLLDLFFGWGVSWIFGNGPVA